jgi:hypothetical protein
MIIERDIRKIGDSILVGIGLGNAVFDILTDRDQLKDCLQMLEQPHRGTVWKKIGDFGIYPITMNLHHDETVSIFLDGPKLEQSRDQGAGIYLEKEEFRQLLIDVLASVELTG